MDNCFQMNFTTQQVNAMTNLALAHVGDGAYELLVRSYLALRGDKTVKNLHQDRLPTSWSRPLHRSAAW